VNRGEICEQTDTSSTAAHLSGYEPHIRTTARLYRRSGPRRSNAIAAKMARSDGTRSAHRGDDANARWRRCRAEGVREGRPIESRGPGRRCTFPKAGRGSTFFHRPLPDASARAFLLVGSNPAGGQRSQTRASARSGAADQRYAHNRLIGHQAISPPYDYLAEARSLRANHARRDKRSLRRCEGREAPNRAARTGGGHGMTAPAVVECGKARAGFVRSRPSWNGFAMSARDGFAGRVRLMSALRAARR